MTIRAKISRALLSAIMLLLSACAQDPTTAQCSAFDKGCKERAIYEAIDSESSKMVSSLVQQARLDMEKGNFRPINRLDNSKLEQSLCRNFSFDSWPVSLQQCLSHVSPSVMESYDEQVNVIYKENEARRREEKIKSDNEVAARDADLKRREQQGKAKLQADLRSGRVKPSNFEQEIYVRSATDGGSLAGAPRIKADGQKYYLSGQVYRANGDASVIASKLPNDLVALQHMIMTGADNAASTDYFAVNIPDELKSYYESHARIGGKFDVIGRYVENREYQTVSGEMKLAPVFNAEYLKFRD